MSVPCHAGTSTVRAPTSAGKRGQSAPFVVVVNPLMSTGDPHVEGVEVRSGRSGELGGTQNSAGGGRMGDRPIARWRCQGRVGTCDGVVAFFEDLEKQLRALVRQTGLVRNGAFERPSQRRPVVELLGPGGDGTVFTAGVMSRILRPGQD
jgi:hypothetical protein